MTKKYFCGDAKGLKADIERHSVAEKELEAKIKELEGKTDKMSIVVLETYRGILNTLQQSKADVVSKIGKKK